MYLSQKFSLKVAWSLSRAPGDNALQSGDEELLAPHIHTQDIQLGQVLNRRDSLLRQDYQNYLYS